MNRLPALLATVLFAGSVCGQDATELEDLPSVVSQTDLESQVDGTGSLSLQAPQQTMVPSDLSATQSARLPIDSSERSMVSGPFVEAPVTEHPGPIEMATPPTEAIEHYSQPLTEIAAGCGCGGRCHSRDIMDVRKYSLLDYRRMFMRHRAPTPIEMAGSWRGVNKGIVRLAGIKQFIKEIQPCGSVTFGDNIEVHQVSDQMLRCCGWQPKVNARTGNLRRNGKYKVKRPNFLGPFGHGAIFSYREGGNRWLDPRRVIVDKVVLVDCNHLLGRASVRIGLIPIPVGYFVLERM